MIERKHDPVYNTGLEQEKKMAVRLNIIMEEAIYKRLKREVPAKRMSAFINEAVRAKLHPDKETLDAAYREARTESWRNTFSKDWTATEAEGWPE